MKKLIIFFVSLGLITTAAVTTFNESKNNSSDFPVAGFISTKDVQIPVASENAKVPTLPSARSSSGGSTQQSMNVSLSSSRSTTPGHAGSSVTVGMPQLSVSSSGYSVLNEDKNNNSSSSSGLGASGLLAIANKKGNNGNSSEGSYSSGGYVALNQRGKQDGYSSITSVMGDDPITTLDEIEDLPPVLLQPANTPVGDGLLFLLTLCLSFIFLKRKL